METTTLFQKFQNAFSPETLKLLTFRLPEVGSSHAQEIDFVMYLVHYLMLFLFVGWAIFFTLTLVKFRQQKNKGANYHGVKNHISSYIEIGVVTLEVILLVGFSIPYWNKQVNNYPQRDDKVEVRVVAEQFAWNVHYPGEDKTFGKSSNTYFDKQSNPLGLDPNDPNGDDDFTTINQLHLPIGKPAIVHLTSKDVMHSFGLPTMRVKQDIIPGMSIPTWFTPTKSGTSEIACAQLCGIGHYYMRGKLTIHHEDKFNSWLASNASASSGGSGGGAGDDGYDDFWN